MGQVKLSNLFLALAAGLDLVKTQPGSLEALSCHRAARFTGPIKKNKFFLILVNKVNEKKLHIRVSSRRHIYSYTWTRKLLHRA